MKIGSLFSGVGGIELGFEREGFTTEWFVEREPYAQAILRKHWPGVPIYDDVTTIDFSTIPRVDVLTGGFPCQDISNAGKRAGIIEGKRSSLWKYYLEAIRQIRPKFAVIENVSALSGRGLWVVLADLAQIGYDAEWKDIRACDVGAPHRRERIFIVAYPNSLGCNPRGDKSERGNDIPDREKPIISKEEIAAIAGLVAGIFIARLYYDILEEGENGKTKTKRDNESKVERPRTQKKDAGGPQ